MSGLRGNWCFYQTKFVFFFSCLCIVLFSFYLPNKLISDSNSTPFCSSTKTSHFVILLTDRPTQTKLLHNRINIYLCFFCVCYYFRLIIVPRFVKTANRVQVWVELSLARSTYCDRKSFFYYFFRCYFVAQTIINDRYWVDAANFYSLINCVR